MYNSSFGRRISACGLVIAALGIAACKSDAETTEAPLAQTVTIIGIDTPESQILVDVYSRALEGAGFRVARRADAADLAGEYAALKSGAADLMVGHTGELLAYLAETEPAAANTSTTAAPTTIVESTTSAVETTTTEATEATDTTDTTDTTGDSTDDAADASTTLPLEESTTTTISTAGQASAISLNLQANQIGEILPDTLQQGASANAEDKPVIACRADISTGITLLSDLARGSESLRIAGVASFETDEPFGLPGFEEVYGATFEEFVAVPEDGIGDAFAPAVEEDTTSTTTAASTADSASDESTTTTEAAPIETDADCGAFASSLDPAITAGMVVLDDDKNWVPNNGVIPILTATAYTPGVQQIIDQVSQALSTDFLRAMISQVDAGALPGTVAGQFLTAVGIAG